MKPVFRVSICAPIEYANQIKRAVSEAGGARIGNYRDVFWTSAPGVEEFCPESSARPALGRAEEKTAIPSVQIMFIIPQEEELQRRVLSAIHSAHPWEKPIVFFERGEVPE